MEHFQQLVSSFLKKLQSWRKSKYTPLALILIGFALMTFGGVSYYRVRILSFSSPPPEAVKKTQNIDTPIEILIPSIGIDLPVAPGQIKDGVWQISDKEATFLSTSAAPGSGGNTVIYGHNKQVIFGNLPFLSMGQKIFVKTRSGKLYSYISENKYFVGPDRVDLVSPTTSEELTIYTCYGLFDSQRVVIVAKPQ